MLSLAAAFHRNLHAVGGGGESYFNGRRIRVGHLTGGVVAVLSMGNSDNNRTAYFGSNDEKELVEASRLRVRSYQDWAVALGKQELRMSGEVFVRAMSCRCEKRFSETLSLAYWSINNHIACGSKNISHGQQLRLWEATALCDAQISKHPKIDSFG